MAELSSNRLSLLLPLLQTMLKIMSIILTDDYQLNIVCNAVCAVKLIKIQIPMSQN